MKKIIDNISSMLWFCMDVCWMGDLDVLAALLIVPTVYATMMMFYYADWHFMRVLAAVATNSWVLMNVCWMVPDLSDASWLHYLHLCRWVFMGLAIISMGFIMITDFGYIRNIKRFR